MNRFYNVYGWLILGLLGFLHWYGWAWVDADRLTGVPRTVRDNPGSYRSTYTQHTHYTGGK
jgi:hypothetical protein